MAQEWRVDASNQATLSETETATDWRTFSGWKSWGYGDDTIWIKIQLRANTRDERAPWVVRIRPAFLDHVTLFDPATGKMIKTGDAEPPVDDSASIVFSPEISPLPYERTIYLKIRSASSRTLIINVLPYEEAHRQNRLQEWFLGFLTISSLLFTVWAFFQWVSNRESLIGAFALKQLVLSCWLFFNLGFARIVFGLQLNEGVLTILASSLAPWAISSSIWFYYRLLKGYQPDRFILHAFKAMVVINFFLPLLNAVKPQHLILSTANVSLLITYALLLIAILNAFPKKVKQPIPAVYLLVYFSVYVMINSLPPFMYWGWIEVNALALLSGAAHVVLDAAVMFSLLQFRARSLNKEQQKIALDFQRSMETAVIEKRHREEQSQLFAMLAHEMKTPLATLRMWMQAGQLKPETMERAIADMNSVIERCVHTDQLADQGLKATPQRVSPTELTRNCIQSCRSPELVDLTAPSTDHAIQTDAQMLSIALSNLLDNACKYGASHGRIKVNLSPAARDGCAGWRWEIHNQVGSAGLPDPDRLFEKYYRSPRAKSLSGSGLGLYLVKRLLELLHGSIHFESQQDKACFSIWLPDAFTER